MNKKYEQKNRLTRTGKTNVHTSTKANQQKLLLYNYDVVI